MNYTECIETQAPLKKDVLCYWQMRGDINDEAGLNSRQLPKGQNLLVFNYGDEVGYFNTPEHSLNRPFFIVPAIATSRMIYQKGTIDLFGISLIGEGLFKLIKHPASKLTTDFPEALKAKYKAYMLSSMGSILQKRLKLPENS